MARKGFLGRLLGGGKGGKKKSAPARAAPVHKPTPRPAAPAPKPKPVSTQRQSEFERVQRLVNRGEASSSALLPYYYRQVGREQFHAGLLQLPREDLRGHAHHLGIPVQGRTNEEISSDITTHVRTCKGCRLGTLERHRLKMKEG